MMGSNYAREIRLSLIIITHFPFEPHEATERYYDEGHFSSGSSSSPATSNLMSVEITNSVPEYPSRSDRISKLECTTGEFPLSIKSF